MALITTVKILNLVIKYQKCLYLNAYLNLFIVLVT